MLDGSTIRGTETVNVLGIGVVLTRDTRDRVIAPRRGSLHVLRARVHPEGLGNTYGYTQVRADLRAYVPVARGHVLAVRGLAATTTANPPFDELPALGGDEVMRGYFEGRFRDRQMLVLEADYRFPIA